MPADPDPGGETWSEFFDIKACISYILILSGQLLIKYIFQKKSFKEKFLLQDCYIPH